MNAKRLTTPKEKVQQLQEKLGHAAKENKKRKIPRTVRQGLPAGYLMGSMAKGASEQGRGRSGWRNARRH